MNRFLLVMLSALAACSSDDPESPWVFTSDQFTTNPVFSDVQSFAFKIDVQGPLAVGTAYVDPPLVEVEYRVAGFLVAGTPSNFDAFELERTITGSDFYAQGSSLRFEIAAGADLGDGIQVSDLVGTSTVFTFDGREIDNGRFHPALFELRADGTGRMQNSNNVPTLDPRLDVPFGAEYVTELTFDPRTVTVVDVIPN